ncbi:hypothetical protein D3C78_688120 [compost metagenome]
MQGFPRQAPFFQGAGADVRIVGGGRSAGQLRCGGDPSRVHRERQVAIGLDRPRLLVGAIGAAEGKGAVASLGEQSLVGWIVAVQGQRDHHGALRPGRFAVDRRFGRLEVRRIHRQVLATVGLHAQLQEHADAWVALVPLGLVRLVGVLDHRLVLAGQHVGQGNRLFGALPGVVFLEVDEVDAVARLNAVLRKVDDDVVALGDALHRQDREVVLQIAVAVEVHAAVERHGMLHDVAVVGDHVERHALVGDLAGRPLQLTAAALDFTHHCQLDVARYRTVEDAEAIAACAHVEIRLV